MLFDTHMHTRFSADSRMTVDEALTRRKELGLGIILTEHMDLDYPETPNAFVFDVDEYFAAYGSLRDADTLLGIEIGLRPDLVAENRKVANGWPFDFVLGSLHVVDLIDIYQEHFYQGRTKREAYGQYFEAMLACAKSCEFYDSLGHVDYIARYARFPDTEVYYSEFADYLDAVLKAVASADKAMEINTRRLDKPGVAKALGEIYRRFRELGGRLVTIGSDAHRPEDIGKHFDMALDMATACGLQPVYYKERAPQVMAR